MPGARKRNGKPARRRRWSFAFALDERGVAERALPDRGAAANWLDKHRPGLSPEEKKKRIWTLSSRKAARKFFEDQIRLGCADADVLAFVTLCDGTSTEWGLDLGSGRARRRNGKATEGTIKAWKTERR